MKNQIHYLVSFTADAILQMDPNDPFMFRYVHCGSADRTFGERISIEDLNRPIFFPVRYFETDFEDGPFEQRTMTDEVFLAAKEVLGSFCLETFGWNPLMEDDANNLLDAEEEMLKRRTEKNLNPHTIRTVELTDAEIKAVLSYLKDAAEVAERTVVNPIFAAIKKLEKA